MSEIFNWQKKAESDREKSPARFNLISAEPVPYTISEDKDEAEPIAPTPKSVVLSPPASSGNAEFDFSTGDLRVNSILDPQSFGGEQFRLMRAKLSLMQKDRAIQRILITSALPGEGKTFTCCTLAGILAQEPGKRVLLVDSDLRKPKAAQTLGCAHPDGLVGLCQVLQGEISPVEALLKSKDIELYLLPSGGIPQNPSELLSSPNLETTLKSLSGMFDWIIVDSPPILALADSTLLVPLCDTVILVARAEHTPTKLIQEAIHRIGREKICGVTVNRVKRFKNPRYYHYYYQQNKKTK
jgi:capsular exopolysaccharide synthesis family protein